MTSLIALVALFAVLAAVVAAIKAFSRSTRGSRPKIDPNWEPPKSDPLPYVRRNYFFSAAERSFYEVIRRLLPQHTVFAKVGLSDLIRVDKGTRSWRSYHNKIDRKHLDFVICDQDLAPVLAVELDDSSHDAEDRRERDEFVDQALAAAGLAIIHVRAKRGYKLEELRALFSPNLKMTPQSASEVVESDSRYMAHAGWRPGV
jgi:hypothetical protein